MSATVVDCTGKPCPMPVIELAHAVEAARPGEVVELIADDPAAAVDVAAWCRMKEHDLLSSTELPDRPAVLGDTVTAYRVRRRPDPVGLV